MSKVTVAASSRIAAEAGAEIADFGGNAVDAAVAASIVSMCTDIGIMAPAAGAFVSLWPGDAQPIVFDGYAEMPGRGMAVDALDKGTIEAVFDYGGEMRSLVGYGSVATPGAFAGLAMASSAHGRLPWARLLEPAIRWTDKGFPLGAGAAEYMSFTHEAIFSWNRESYNVLHNSNGSLLAAGETVHVPDLAGALRMIAEEGPGALYGGELGQRIAAGVRAGGGLLGIDDLRAYRAIERQPTMARLGDWEVATNPPPAVGGVCLAAMLALLNDKACPATSEQAVAAVLSAQQAVLGYRARHLDGAHEAFSVQARRLLELANQGSPEKLLGAPSTCHVSATDSDGLACAITASAGYGSGAMVTGTGFWLNNSLGEVDLHPGGLAGIVPGTRLASNMAPTVARRSDGSMLAIGSPGASRITTAIAQALFNHACRGLSLAEAVAEPRLHVEKLNDKWFVAYERGLNVPREFGPTPRELPGRSMYFGGVQATLWNPQLGLSAVADVRRGGATAAI